MVIPICTPTSSLWEFTVHLKFTITWDYQTFNFHLWESSEMLFHCLTWGSLIPNKTDNLFVPLLTIWVSSSSMNCMIDLSRGWENHEPNLAPSTSGLTQAACVKEADKECSFKELARTVVGVQGGPSWLNPHPQKELPRLEMGLRYRTQDWTTRSLSLEAPPQSESSRLPATFLGRVQFPKPIPPAPPQKGVASRCRSPRQNHHSHH